MLGVKGCEDEMPHSAWVVLNVYVFISLQLQTTPLKLLSYEGLMEKIQLEVQF